MSMYAPTSVSDIVQYVQTACGEVAYDDCAKENFPKLYKKAKRLGVRDFEGWLGDELYNDVGMIEDLAGDKFSDFCVGKTLEEKEAAAIELAGLFRHVDVKEFLLVTARM